MPRTVADGYAGPLLAAEGDSWFQFPFVLKDVIDWTFERFAVYCRSEAGDASARLDERALGGAEAFCLELIGRIDSELGPELPAADAALTER